MENDEKQGCVCGGVGGDEGNHQKLNHTVIGVLENNSWLSRDTEQVWVVWEWAKHSSRWVLIVNEQTWCRHSGHSTYRLPFLLFREKCFRNDTEDDQNCKRGTADKHFDNDSGDDEETDAAVVDIARDGIHIDADDGDRIDADDRRVDGGPEDGNAVDVDDDDDGWIDAGEGDDKTFGDDIEEICSVDDIDDVVSVDGDERKVSAGEDNNCAGPCKDEDRDIYILTNKNTI